MTKRMGLILALGLLASMASLQAAACSNTTLNVLTAQGFSCTVDDKIFSNFTYTPLSGAPAASAVTAITEFNSVSQNYGWLFTGLFAGNFTLGYTVSVDTAICSSCRINSAAEQLFPGQNPPGTQAIAVTEGGSGTVNINNSSFSSQSNGMVFAGVTSLTKTAVSSGLGAGSTLDSFESSVHESAVPEPMTLSMMGLGLLGLGLMRRRQVSK